MTKRTDLLALSYYEHSPFSGSNEGRRYRIEKQESDEEKKLLLTWWDEPFSFEKTPDDQKESALFDFSEEGLSAITEKINSL